MLGKLDGRDWSSLYVRNEWDLAAIKLLWPGLINKCLN